MEGFNIGLALLDYIPVAAFGVGITLIGKGFGSPLFMVGALLSLLAGVFKATWKLILGISGKDIKWLNKPFVPMQAAGWMVMLLAVVLNAKKIKWTALLPSVCALPQLVFFILWAVLLFAMSWYRKNRFQRDDAHTNWVAEIINSCCQLAFLLGIIFAVK